MDSLVNRTGKTGMFRRLLKGGAWMGIGSAAENGVRFARNMILARLLAPEAFGVMAIVLSVCSLFQVLTGLGVKEAIVQNPRGAERTYLNGAWWLSFARGIFLYLAAVIAAPWVSRFYNAPELTYLLRIAFLGVLAASATSAGAFVAIKRMQYPKWVMIQQGGSLIGITTTLLLAIWLKGVLALVIGYAVEGLVKSLLSYIICPYRPDFTFDKEDLRAVMRFAGGMFGLPLLMLVYTEGAIFTVGKLCTKEELGIFAIVLTLARVPSMFSGQVVDLLMPAFSEVQKDRHRVNQGILKVTTLAVFFGLPTACLMAIYGKQILLLAFGNRYSAGALPLAILFLNELMLVCSVPMATVYMAIGKPTLLRRFSLLRAVLMAVLVVQLTKKLGILGAALAPLIAMLASYGLQLTSLRSVTELDIRSYFKVWLRGAIVALPWALFFAASSFCLRGWKPAFSLVGAGIGAAILGLIAAALFYSQTRIRRYFWPFAGKLG
jgi:lipopolysaccharide exporter